MKNYWVNKARIIQVEQLSQDGINSKIVQVHFDSGSIYKLTLISDTGYNTECFGSYDSTENCMSGILAFNIWVKLGFRGHERNLDLYWAVLETVNTTRKRPDMNSLKEFLDKI